MRSIQTARDADSDTVLLLGAATGIYRWPIDGAQPDLTLLVDGARSVRGGFNAATLVGGRVFASHSELGLCEWNLGEPTAVKRRFESMTREAKAVRAVQFLDGDLYCAIDDRVIRWPADDTSDRPTHIYTGSATTITALCPTSSGVFAGNGEGDILHWPVESQRRSLKRRWKGFPRSFNHYYRAQTKYIIS